MIIEALFSPIFALIESIFALIRIGEIKLPGWMGDTMGLIADAMMFFPVDVWVVVLANVGFWLLIQFGWAIIEWVYKKIPGVN